MAGGATSRPRVARVFKVELESGQQMIYIADAEITKQEAGKRLRAKFGMGGKFIR